MFRQVIESTEAPQLQSFSGVTLTGNSEEGDLQIVRAYHIGDSFVVARAIGRGKTLDALAAKRFLDSVRFQMPWRIRMISDIGVSIAVPAYASNVPDQHDRHAHSFVVGAKYALRFWATVLSGRQPLTNDPSQIASVEPISRHGRIVSSKPVKHESEEGIELLIDGAHEHGRIRVFSTRCRSYVFGVFSTAMERLNDPEAMRFLESVQWYGDEQSLVSGLCE